MNAALRLSIKQWAPQDRPSDKLQNLGAEQMSDAELISLLVGSFRRVGGHRGRGRADGL